MATGRGLASLIPNRQIEDPDDLDEIESIDSVEEEAAAEATEVPTAEDGSTTVGIPVVEEDEDAPSEPVSKTEEVKDSFDDFSQLDGGEAAPPPSKPLITPLELDPEEDADLIDLAREAATKRKQKEAIHQPKARLPEKKPAAVKKPKAAAKTELKGDKSDQHEEQVQQIPLGDISINPLQPRRNFDPAEMAELKESIDQHGILQPLVVRRIDANTYELIAGERRLRAAKELNWTKVPAVVRRDVSGDQTRLVYALIENIQREALDPIELALAYKSLHDEYGLSHQEIGTRVGKSRVSVTNDMRVLQLPAEVQRGLSEGKITPGHGRAILMIPDPDKQVRFYQHLLDEGLTVRKAETRARRIQRTMGVDPKRLSRRNRHPLAQKFQPPLEERYSADVNVMLNDEKNRFEIHFRAHSVSDFKQLVGRLMGTEDLPDYSKDDELLDD